MILHRTSAKTCAFSFFNENYLTHRSKSCVEGFFDMSMSLHMLVLNYLFVPLPVSTVDFFVLLGASGGGLTRLSWPPSLFAAVAAFISLQWFMNFVTSWFQSQQKKRFRKWALKISSNYVIQMKLLRGFYFLSLYSTSYFSQNSS